MTNKEFFLATLAEEAPKFRAVIEALPSDNHSYKVHDRAREAGNLVAQLALQWKAISGIVLNGVPSFNPHEIIWDSTASVLAKFEDGVAQLEKDLASISDAEWETGQSGWGAEPTDTKYHMAWMFLFDAIHHRGQVATYLRAMGAVVPAIYGPSADSQK
jgi:hypothetical protein